MKSQTMKCCAVPSSKDTSIVIFEVFTNTGNMWQVKELVSWKKPNNWMMYSNEGRYVFYLYLIIMEYYIINKTGVGMPETFSSGGQKITKWKKSFSIKSAEGYVEILKPKPDNVIWELF